jgi:hypothetical protein
MVRHRHEQLGAAVTELLAHFPDEEKLVAWIAETVDIHDGTTDNTSAIALGEALLAHRNGSQDTPAPDEGWKQLLWDLGVRHWNHAMSEEIDKPGPHLRRAVELYELADAAPADGDHARYFRQDAFNRDYARLLTVVGAHGSQHR